MAGRVDGKVAFVTGAARGQGRSHAVRLAQEGADVIAVDICRHIENTMEPSSTPADLAKTADLIKALDRRVVTAEVDVRDYDALKAAVDSGVEQLGRLDIVVANAGMGTPGAMLDEMDEPRWQQMMDVNLSGVWKSVKAAVPHLKAGGRGGSVILTSSVGGLKAYPHVGHYITAKHGVVGLMRSFAVELGQYRFGLIRYTQHTSRHRCCTMMRPTGPFVPIWRTRARTTWPRSVRTSTFCRSPGCRPWTSATRCCTWLPTNHVT